MEPWLAGNVAATRFQAIVAWRIASEFGEG